VFKYLKGQRSLWLIMGCSREVRGSWDIVMLMENMAEDHHASLAGVLIDGGTLLEFKETRHCIALTTKSKYVVAAHSVKEALGLKVLSVKSSSPDLPD